MESMPLVLTDPNLLAEFARESEFKTFFEKRFASPPDLAALLFRDGAFVNGFKGTQFSIGGLWENMKGLIGGSHHYAILLADLKPFQVQFPIRAMARDQVEITGVATLELQLNPDKPGNILGLMGGVSRSEGGQGNAGRKALSRFDVLGRIEPQFQDRVFEHVIGRHDAADVRGNRGLQDQLQADMMAEAERICGDLGVLVRNASITFAMNEVERENFEKARIERQEEMLDYQLGLLKREMSRQGEAAEIRIQTEVDLAKVKQAGEDELAHMVLNSQVAFVDAREAHTRRQEMDAIDYEIRKLRTEDLAIHERAIQGIGNQTEQVLARQQLVHATNQLKTIEQEHAAQLKILDAKARRDANAIDIETRDGTFQQDLAETKSWQELAIEKLRVMNEIEGAKLDQDADRRIKESDAGARQNVDQMLAANQLSPEQLAQVMPGLSEQAAQVAIARAQAEGANAKQMLEIAREMTTESREHEHRMFGTGMQGGAGMAAGLGGAGIAGTAGVMAEGIVECPGCGRENLAKARFCAGCSRQLRT